MRRMIKITLNRGGRRAYHHHRWDGLDGQGAGGEPCHRPARRYRCQSPTCVIGQVMRRPSSTALPESVRLNGFDGQAVRLALDPAGRVFEQRGLPCQLKRLADRDAGAPCHRSALERERWAHSRFPAPPAAGRQAARPTPAAASPTPPARPVLVRSRAGRAAAQGGTSGQG